MTNTASAEVMAAVVPEEEHTPSLVVAGEMGVVLSVVKEEAPASSEEAEVLGETGVVQGVVVEEGPPLTNGSLRDWVKRWCSGDRRGLPPVSMWNTSRVTDMHELFRAKSKFNDDIGAWDTSGVTNMCGMFCGASAFNQPLGGWSVDKDTAMYWMFYKASAFNQPLGAWRIACGCYTGSMFAGADFQNSRPVKELSCCARFWPYGVNEPP